MRNRYIWILLLMLACGTVLMLLRYRTSSPARAMGRENQMMRELTRLGWIYVYVPRNVFEPGALTSVSERNGLRYRGHIRDCVPNEILLRQSSPAALPTLKGKWSLDAKGFLRFVNIGRVAPAYQEVAQVDISVGKTVSDAINELKLVDWLERNKADLSITCRRYLLHPNVYVITEALRVENYTYTFRDVQGAKIALSVEKMQTLFHLETEIQYDIASEGNLQIREPLYIAFRKAKFVSFEEIAGAAQRADPTEIMQRYLKHKFPDASR